VAHCYITPTWHVQLVSIVEFVICYFPVLYSQCGLVVKTVLQNVPMKIGEVL
jgi:hypothetical protein